MRYYRLRDVKAPQFSGEYTAVRKWRLPGITCPVCQATWGVEADAWPCVDLSALPEARALEEARLEEDYAAFERLREKVRPFVPSGAPLRPGTAFGPLVGHARGEFGELFMQNTWTLLVRGEALARLRAEEMGGLQAAPVELLRVLAPAHPLMEIQPVVQGQLHSDCLPAGRPPPCAQCGRKALRLPDRLILDAASLPTHADVFRLADFATVIVGSERFVETLQRLRYGELDVRELPLR